jgi:hypothetical protein
MRGFGGIFVLLWKKRPIPSPTASDYPKPQQPVSHQHSRKNFFAKLLGLFAVAGVAPKLLAKSTVSSAVAAPVPPAAPFKVSADSRTVARSGDAV